MSLKALKWCPYEEKKWDLMNLVDDNTYEILTTKKISEYLPYDVNGYIRENDFAEHHLAVKVVDAQSSATMSFFNINRIDEEKDTYVIDQDQWFLAWHYGESEPSPSGALFSHGSWKGRTEPLDIPKPWIRNVIDSELFEYIPVPTLPIKSSGNISELVGTSHWSAREQLQAWIKGKNDLEK